MPIKIQLGLAVQPISPATKTSARTAVPMKIVRKIGFWMTTLMWSSRLCLANSSSETIVGTASVIDGDTIEIHGKRIRFNGIDAPESASFARKMAEPASLPTTCKFIERYQYGRFVGN